MVQEASALGPVVRGLNPILAPVRGAASGKSMKTSEPDFLIYFFVK